MKTRHLLSTRHGQPFRIPMRAPGSRSTAIHVDSAWLSDPASSGRLVTDVRLQNPRARTVEGRLVLAPAGAAAPLAMRFLLGPYESIGLSDAFGAGSPGEGAGTLSVESADGLPTGLSIRARVFGRPDRDPAPSRAIFAAGLAQGGDFSSDLETFNTSAQPLSFGISLAASDGRVVGVRGGLSLAPGESASWALAELFPGVSGDALSLGLSPERGSSAPAARASVTDLRTGSRVPVAAASPASRIFLPVVGWTAGGGDASFASDLVLGNVGARRLAVRARFLEANRENVRPPAVVLHLEAGETKRIEDVLGTLYGLAGVTGLLELDAGEPSLVVAASKTARSAGSPGTYGAADDPIREDRFSTESLLAAPQGSGALSRVGLVNPGELALPVLLRWVDASGTVVAETAAVVPGSSWIDVVHEGAAGEATMVLITSGRPHFALIPPAVKMSGRPGGFSERERAAR
jgi:hypothetical protein